jgi:hypothetical protein
MSLDTIEPTKEWIEKHVGQIEKPRRDQKVARVAYRKLSPFEVLFRNEDIDDEQFRAAQKLTRHWLGSQGVNVCDDVPSGSEGDPPEFARTYHAQKFAEARATVAHVQQWDAIMTMLDETGTVECVGRAWKQVKCRKQARAYGVSLVAFGLEALARLWGIRDPRTFHSRDRPAA